MIDVHCHLIPGFDDGAVDLDESRMALAAIVEQGVRAIVATPHLAGSVTTRPARLEAYFERLEPAWRQLVALAGEAGGGLRVERGTEVMLDTPAPDVSDSRVRLAGTRFVLVEFPHMMVPPNSVTALFELRARGWIPVVAHPERYRDAAEEAGLVEQWRGVGALLQVNCGALVGAYGTRARSAAWALLRAGRVDCLASDYHARGTCSIAAAREALVEAGGEEQARLLMEVNPSLLLAGDDPEPVPPLHRTSPRSFWTRIFGPGRG
jgi:protein-tyrosine phosphatase